jgi:hypothetical protein
MTMNIIDALNPAPRGPVTARPRRSILNLTRRARRQAVKSRIRDLRRTAAAEAANAPRYAPAKVETPFPTEAALLSAMTRDQLRAEAKSRGLKNYGSLNKAGLRALLGVES